MSESVGVYIGVDEVVQMDMSEDGERVYLLRGGRVVVLSADEFKALAAVVARVAEDMKDTLNKRGRDLTYPRPDRG